MGRSGRQPAHALASPQARPAHGYNPSQYIDLRHSLQPPVLVAVCLPASIPMSWFRRFSFALLPVAAAWLLMPIAQAADPAQVLRLHASGDTAAALEQAASHLQEHPRDAQMRFVQANLLAETGRSDEARQQLQTLTTEHPELAEPWNNLAVLYAAQGELQQAQQALQTALQIQPDYATALENLGDVHLRMALDHWQQAARQDPGNARLKARVQTLQQLLDAAP